MNNNRDYKLKQTTKAIGYYLLFTLIPLFIGVVLYFLGRDPTCGKQIYFFAQCVSWAYIMMTVAAGWFAFWVTVSVVVYLIRLWKLP
jgi:hypothetical protein